VGLGLGCRLGLYCGLQALSSPNVNLSFSDCLCPCPLHNSASCGVHASLGSQSLSWSTFPCTVLQLLALPGAVSKSGVGKECSGDTRAAKKHVS